MRQVPHRLQAELADSRDLVGRFAGLRDELAQVQNLRGFQRPAKFTYKGLSEVVKYRPVADNLKKKTKNEET